MSKNSCKAAESIEDAVLRMARAELLQFFHFFIFFKKTLDFFLESDIITMLLTGNNKKQHKTVQCGMV